MSESNNNPFPPPGTPVIQGVFNKTGPYSGPPPPPPVSLSEEDRRRLGEAVMAVQAQVPPAPKMPADIELVLVRNELETLKAFHKSANERVESYRKMLRDERKAHDEVRRELLDSERLQRAAIADRDDLLRQLRDLEAKLSDQEAHLAQLRSERNKLEAEKKGLEKASEALRETNDELRKENQQLETDNSGMLERLSEPLEEEKKDIAFFRDGMGNLVLCWFGQTVYYNLNEQLARQDVKEPQDLKPWLVFTDKDCTQLTTRVPPSKKQLERKLRGVEKKLYRALHNLVVHPAQQVLPKTLGEALHDFTAERAFGEVQNPPKDE